LSGFTGYLSIAHGITGPYDKFSPPAAASTSSACSNMTPLFTKSDHPPSARAMCFGVGFDSEGCDFVFLFSLASAAAPSCSQSSSYTGRALTGVMLDSYAERCNDIMFSINVDELDGPIAVHLMVME
jgi:hypothetical protein